MGMKRLLSGALAGISLLALGTAIPAFETVMVGGVEATRIVIAPPRTPIATTIRDGLRDTLQQATSGSRTETDARQLYYFYGARYFEPIWLSQDAEGTVQFSPAAQGIVALFETAHLQGLNPADYLSDALDLSSATADPGRLAALESSFSAAVLRYAQDAYSGRLNPRSVSGNIDISRKRLDETVLFTSLATASDPAAILMDLHPKHREFVALRDLLAAHYDGTIPDQVAIADGSLLRQGASDPRVPLLRERLGLEAAEDASVTVYDAALVDAIKAFQTSMGLNADGVVGPATVAALNGANGASRADIIANMERWRWMPETLGDFHVFVNIPEYRLEVTKYGDVMWDTRVIVGQARRQTPIFSDNIRHVVTNPYWNVPPTILREDVMPNVRANPGYIASQNMELLYGGKVIDAYQVDWSEANPNLFRVRQKPGRSNALGQVKFLFPNQHDVYLHDTNSPGLFSRSMRALSSGCVRVEDPFAFAEALLQLEPSFTVASLQNSLGPNERWFTMDHRVPVHLAYFTLRVGEDGTVRSYGDLYGHNAGVIAALGL